MKESKGDATPGVEPYGGSGPLPTRFAPPAVTAGRFSDVTRRPGILKFSRICLHRVWGSWGSVYELREAEVNISHFKAEVP